MKKTDHQGLLTPEQIRSISNIKNIADSTMEAGQEFLLCVEQVLMDNFGFSEKDLKRFHNELERIMMVVREAEGAGLNSIGIRTIRALGEIAEIRKRRKEIDQTGIALPKLDRREIVNKLLK